MTTSPRERVSGSRFAMSRPLLLEVLAPLALFYGLRALGVSQFLALSAGVLFSMGRAAHSTATERRVSGVTVFIICTMSMSVAMSCITGSPRLLLIRNGWAMAAIGLWMVLTAFRRRPPLYEATRIVLDEDGRRTWTRNWEQFEAFRSLLRICSLVWGIACLFDAAVRTVLAFTLPVDLVPVLDDVLLGITLAALLLFQRLYGSSYLRKHGLVRRGVEVTRLIDPPARPTTARA